MSDMHTECKKAYADYPSQDNEGYQPDRAGFKCGFHSAWGIQQKVIDEYQSETAALLIEQEHRLGSKIESLEYTIKALLGTIKELSK